jgi:leucyl-tRNA synthetase
MTLDMKSMTKKFEKSEMKKAMPFVQALKKRLEGGEEKSKVFSRDLGFDEVKVLSEMVPGLKATVTKLRQVNIVVVDQTGKAGTKIGADGKEERVEGLNAMVAPNAEPGSPTFEFVNI